MLSLDSPEIPGEVRFVLDGGSLLQCVSWTQGTTYGEICTAYIDYVTKKYIEAIVVLLGMRDHQQNIWHIKGEPKDDQE